MNQIYLGTLTSLAVIPNVTWVVLGCRKR